MKSHKDLDVWKRSVEYVTMVYKITTDFPNTEIYGLTNQIRRCAVSIPSNIAEGAARTSLKEFSHFLSIALGSLSELETQLLISTNLEYISNEKYNVMIDELSQIRKMIIGLKKSLVTRH